MGEIQDPLLERRPGGDQLFQAGARVELNQALTEREPFVDGPRDDVVRDINCQDNRPSLTWKSRGLLAGIFLRRAEQERSGFERHGKPVFPRLTPGLQKTGIGSPRDDLLRAPPGCSMKQDHSSSPADFTIIPSFVPVTK